MGGSGRGLKGGVFVGRWVGDGERAVVVFKGRSCGTGLVEKPLEGSGVVAIVLVVSVVVLARRRGAGWC